MRIRVTEDMVSEGECSDRLQGSLLDNARARTIASWWQSPGSVGHVLASFASGAWVDPAELQDDILYTVRGNTSGDSDDTRDLLDLYAWVTVKGTGE